MVEVKKVSERIYFTKSEVDKNILLSIIQVYAHILDAKVEEIDMFYKSLQETILKEKEFFTVVMGDWNSKIRKNTSFANNYCVTSYGIGEWGEVNKFCKQK